MDSAKDIVNRALIDQQTRVFCLCKQGSDLLFGGCDRERRQVRPMDQDVRRALLGEVDGVFQQLTLVFVNATVLLDFLHQHQQLLVGHFVFCAEMEYLGQQLFPEGKEGVQRGKDPN